MAQHESDRWDASDRDQLVKLRVELRYLSGAIQKLEDHVKDVVTDIDKRVRILENFRWWMVGAMIGSGVISAVLNKLLERM